MQPHICAIDHKRIVIFQYPQADRASCNSNLVQTPVIYPGLSVSSSGSSIMQPVQLNLIFSGAQSFSILKRIEHHATVYVSRETLIIYDFQYPQADRASCNKT